MHFAHSALDRVVSLFSLISLIALASALPVHQALFARGDTKCGDGRSSPCICDNAFGLRNKNPSCSGNTFTYSDPSSPTDGKMEFQTSNFGISTNCDHIVELQLIAAEIASRPSICPAFVAKPDSFQKFFNKINSPSNLVNVEEKVNGAKKILFANQNFITTTSKAARGAASYLEHLNTGSSAPSIKSAATDIAKSLEEILGAHQGFAAGFPDRIKKDVTIMIKKANDAAQKLGPAPNPSGELQFVICDGRSKRNLPVRIRDYIVERASAGFGIKHHAAKSKTKCSAKQNTTVRKGKHTGPAEASRKKDPGPKKNPKEKKHRKL